MSRAELRMRMRPVFIAVMAGAVGVTKAFSLGARIARAVAMDHPALTASGAHDVKTRIRRWAAPDRGFIRNHARTRA
jgi:hypothetical protein